MFIHLSLCLSLGFGASITGAQLGKPPAKVAVRFVVSLQGNNSIGGHVFNKQGRPVGQLIVELLNDNGSSIGQTRTGNSGRFEFRGLPQGVFHIRVLTYGTNYTSQTERVEIVNFSSRSPSGVRVSGSQYLPVDFTLSTPEERVTRKAPGAIFAQSVPNNARKLYEQAVTDLDGGKGDAGLAGLQKALEAFPSYYLALERLGVEYVKLEKYEPARTALTQATTVNPRAHLSFYWLGLAQHNLKQPAAALESFTRAVSLAPDSVNSQIWLGIALRQNGKLELSETHLKKAKELGKNSVPEVNWQLALLYDKLGRYKEAADELELFLKAQPDSRDTENIKKVIKQLREKAKTEQATQR